MSNQAIVAVGWLVGQFITLSVALYFHQRKLDTSYWKAAPLYFEKEIGGFIIGVAGLCLMLFIAPEFWDSNTNVMDLRIKSTLTWKERIQAYQRFSSAAFGVFIQLILILGVGKGKKAIEKQFDKLG